MTSSPLSIRRLTLPFDAIIALPGSKSHANRAIIAACLAEGTTVLRNATPCDDVALLVQNIRRMGFDARWVDRKKGTLRIRGDMPKRKPKTTLFCGNAGTTLRFLVSLACLTPGEWTVTGDKRMLERPIKELTAALKAIGADIRDADGFPPLRIRGGNMRGGDVTLDASRSSQFLSSLLLIGSALDDGIRIRIASALASPSYIDLTERVIRDFGGTMKRDRGMFGVAPKILRSTGTYDIEGDWSAAGAFLVLAELSGSNVRFGNLQGDSLQGDRMLPQFIEKLRGEGERLIDCSSTPDQVMNLAVLAAHRNGETRITGAANLRIKECDRLAVLREELGKTGIDIAEHPDGLIIRGRATLKPALLRTKDDHRMAMCFAILGSLHADIRIDNPSCVSKSYPLFFKDLTNLKHSQRCIAIVGMRGAGKTHLGRCLASRLKMKHADIDALFERAHGKIAAFVARHGWQAFRTEEERLISLALRPGAVVSLGGGAVECKRTRELLRTQALTVWLKVDESTLLTRLELLKRPPLTSLPLKEEIHLIQKKRTPLYQEVADIVIPDDLPCSKHITHILSQLQKRCSW